ncbi:MAG: glycoside hydrolase [Clostridia bacterium]|nr:glycoside hydrolase [Clostridia bacterium]
MGALYFDARDNTYAANDAHAQRNVFLTMSADFTEIPTYESVKDKLPIPVWEGREDVIDCYFKTWEIGWGNLRVGKAEAGYVSNFIDTAFNGDLFMWDSSFILMFGKYASRYFDFQRTLDNFYAHQNRDGFITRQLKENVYGDRFTRDDPVSTGPNIMPWSEWEYYLSTGDKERLSRVFDPLCAYHNWLRLNRSWQDGTYWSSGLACGMDNSPRQEAIYNVHVSHGFMSWIDTCAQQYLSADILTKMAAVLGRESEAESYREEMELLRQVINEKMWDEKTAFYYDKRRDGTLSGVKTVGSYWTLLAGIVPEERIDKFVAHLDNEREFKRPNRVPTLSADHPEYNATGGYWKGAVWAPTNYMVLCGLNKYGYDRLAFEIASEHLDNVVKVFEETGTVYENYAPESAERGNPAKANFVGWTGLSSIAALFEYVFGIHPDAQNKKLVWQVNLTDEHGIRQYPLGDATVDIICEKRNSKDEKPVIHLTSDKPVTLTVIYNGKSEVYENVTRI